MADEVRSLIGIHDKMKDSDLDREDQHRMMVERFLHRQSIMLARQEEADLPHVNTDRLPWRSSFLILLHGSYVSTTTLLFRHRTEHQHQLRPLALASKCRIMRQMLVSGAEIDNSESATTA